jgi:hypothetical protein
MYATANVLHGMFLFELQTNHTEMLEFIFLEICISLEMPFPIFLLNIKQNI